MLQDKEKVCHLIMELLLRLFSPTTDQLLLDPN